MGRCPLLALSGHMIARNQYPLLGVKRTWRGHHGMSANDPKADIVRANGFDARQSRLKQANAEWHILAAGGERQ